MKYELVNSDCIKQIKKVKRNGYTITNPSDSQLDEWGIGYYLETTDEPEYDPSTQYVTKGYAIVSGKIKEVWTIHEIPVSPEPDPDSTTLTEMIENLNALGITNFTTENDLMDNLRAFGITSYEAETNQ